MKESLSAMLIGPNEGTLGLMPLLSRKDNVVSARSTKNFRSST